jgi:eukaryotic-like serine/threonine-protein kinase
VRTLTFHETIGAGAFGTVYKADLATDQGIRRPVAVKIVLQDHAEKEMFIRRMRDEARLLGLLQDDNILKVIDLLTINDRDAIVMEYIEGIDLSQAVSEGQLPPLRAVLEIGATIAGTLDRAHQARHPESNDHLGVVHRDVKPANVMLTASGSLKLLDFGIAQAKFAARESHTGQMVLGTLNYMAPDYIITGEVTPAIDVYGIGLTLFELVTGEVFGQPKLREDQHNHRLRERLALIEEHSSDLANLLAGMLHWDPESRPHCGEIERALLLMADEMRGAGTRRYAAEVVTAILNQRGEAVDAERLLGRTITMGEAVIPDPMTDAVLDIEAAPTVDELIDDIDDAPTAIADRVALAEGLDPPTAETALPEPAAAPPRPTTPSQAVTIEPSVPSTGSARSAILRGVLIGSSLGALAVCVLAFVLFTYLPPAQFP